MQKTQAQKFILCRNNSRYFYVEIFFNKSDPQYHVFYRNGNVTILTKEIFNMTFGDDFMNTHYTDEKNTLITMALLKAHGIKKVIASPGTTNIRLVASMQQDPFFEMYSAADERSAAYIACGLAYESGEPVVLTCTGATASRNYVPGLTEAFYRKLPVLAITSTQHLGRVGQNIAQVIDRSVQMNDTVRLSVQIPTCHTDEDEWAAILYHNSPWDGIMKCAFKKNKLLTILQYADYYSSLYLEDRPE